MAVGQDQQDPIVGLGCSLGGNQVFDPWPIFSFGFEAPLFWGEGSPTKIDCRERGAFILTSLLEDLVWVVDSR